MPRSALPSHLNDPEEIENAFPDDSQYKGWFGKIYRWYNKKTKTWFAFSYRCHEWWAKWRKTPIVLFAVRGDGKWRAEHPEKAEDTWYGTRLWYGLKPMADDWYLSRIQYHARWCFVVQWPFMVSFHFYPNAKDVPTYGDERGNLKGKVWFGYWNHFDSDLIYWMLTSLYLGRNFK